MKTKKAAGLNNIKPEMYKSTGESGDTVAQTTRCLYEVVGTATVQERVQRRSSTGDTTGCTDQHRLPVTDGSGERASRRFYQKQ